MKSILLFVLSVTLCFSASNAQTISGAWKGKINRYYVELKLLKSGDSLAGTVYYYTSKSQYQRYSVKGYFDPETNDVIWWDELLLEDHFSRGGGITPQLAVADFNCPGNELMELDGSSNDKDNRNSTRRDIHLEKSDEHVFNDEWDWVIENFFVGTNDPRIIDSISRLQGQPEFPEEKEILARKPSVTVQPGPQEKPEVSIAPPPVPASSSNNEKFSQRKKVLQTVIPVTAEFVELLFYDNAQVDGDSIALYLNGRMIFEHIRLTDKAYTIKINASELQDDNELVMVAENLGSIPPNTSFMVAIVGKKRYEARLYANENSSALIRLVKQQE